MQDVEQPDLLAAPPIALIDRIAWAIAVDEALRCVDHGAWQQRVLDPAALPPPSYARKLVTAISGGVFDLLDAVFEFHSLDDLGELA